MILARLLGPSDVGLFALVASLTGLAPVLIDLGTRDAAVQKPKITEQEVSALFWLTLGMGACLAAFLILGSPWLVSYYEEPRLGAIAVYSSLSFVFSAISCQHVALLRRAMMFRRIAVIEVTSNLIGSVVAITMASTGWGYWALVAKPIVTAVYTAIAAFVSCPWMPGIPRLSAGVKEMLKFGVHITGFTVTDYAGRSMDQLALGKVTTATQLGFYRQGLYVYDNAIGLLSISLHSVAVASLSKLRDDLDKLRRSWATALSAVAFFAMPIFSVMAVTSQDIIVILLGAKWEPAGALVEIMALRGIPHVVERTLGWLHVSAGRADRWMRWGIVGSVAHLVALFCGLPFGPKGVVIAYVILMYLLFIPALAYAGKPLGIRARDVVRTVGPQFAGALIALAAGLLLQRSLAGEQVPRLVRIFCLTSLCLAVYYIVVVLLFKVRKPLEVAQTLCRDMLPGKLARLPIPGLGRTRRKDSPDTPLS
jgi:PST family polysaccharide transporter